MRPRNEMILADLITARAEQDPDHEVVVFENAGIRDDETRSYGQLHANAARIAAGLLERGISKGDRFGLLMRNHPEFIETMIAASITGSVFVPIDPRTKGEKLAYTLRHAGCKGAVVADYSLAHIAEIRNGLAELKWLLVLERAEEEGCPTAADIAGAQNLAAVLAAPLREIDSVVDDPKHPLEIIYTSGTTGDPKGVVLSNARYCGAAMLGQLMGYEAGDRPYTGLSLTHGNAQLITLASTLGMRLTAVFSRKFTKSRLWDITRNYNCTVFSLLGGMATAIYSEPVRENDADNPVRFVTSAGMPVSIWEAFEKRFDLKILEAYGAIEGGFAMKPIGVGPVGSFGKAPPMTEIKIVDEEGNECAPGEIGELISRPLGGEKAEVEYYGNEKASQDKTRGGWLRSGDMCHADEEGWLFFDYRKGGAIRHNGDFVNPGFVEKVIAEHPQVGDVFVYGVPAASGAPGEKDVVAAVVPLDAADFSAASVFAACRKGLEANFVPSYLQVVDEIPKTASEKPQERFLIERFSPGGQGVYAQQR